MRSQVVYKGARVVLFTHRNMIIFFCIQTRKCKGYNRSYACDTSAVEFLSRTSSAAHLLNWLVDLASFLSFKGSAGVTLWMAMQGFWCDISKRENWFSRLCIPIPTCRQWSYWNQFALDLRKGVRRMNAPDFHPRVPEVSIQGFLKCRC